MRAGRYVAARVARVRCVSRCMPQHLFINPKDVRSNYGLTYNLIGSKLNQTTFNDGYAARQPPNEDTRLFAEAHSEHSGRWPVPVASRRPCAPALPSVEYSAQRRVLSRTGG
jgi:hypothetical protein